MGALTTYFKDFLAVIRLQDDLRADLQAAHRDLADRLERDGRLKPIFVDTFLQGSYKRSTIIDPEAGDVADVDLVVVTGLSEHQHPDPGVAMDLFVPFLDSNYRGKWERQDRSFGITEGRLKMDMVITSAPSEAMKALIKWRAVRSRSGIGDDIDFTVREAWQEPALRDANLTRRLIVEREGQPLGNWSEDPLRIPDRTQKRWEPTHPLAQIDWAAAKNRRCGGYYLDVVKVLKWWRRLNSVPKYPKGYPLEALIGDACPDGLTSVAEGVVLTLESLRTKWALTAQQRITPYVQDQGVPQNVLARIDGNEFAQFYSRIGPAADIARRAFDSDDKYVAVPEWQKLFGPRFPDPPTRDGGGPGGSEKPTGGFTPKTQAGLIGGGRFA